MIQNIVSKRKKDNQDIKRRQNAFTPWTTSCFSLLRLSQGDNSPYQGDEEEELKNKRKEEE